MKKKQLLFVTYHDEKFDDGLSYALDLARTMNDGISILMVYKRKVMEKFEDLMTVVAFAEANDHKTARELIVEDLEKNNEDYEKKLSLLRGKCQGSGIDVDVSAASTNVVAAIRNFLKQNSSVDMVLLSPSVTNDGSISSKDLNRLVRTASRPIVTMAKNASVRIA